MSSRTPIDPPDPADPVGEAEVDPVDPAEGDQPQPPAGMEGEPGPFLRLVRDQRVAFLIVGATNTLVGFIWFITFQMLLQERAGYMAVLLCAHVASVLCAFVLYRRFVFRVHGHVWRDLWRFELVNLTSLGINAAILPVMVELAGLPVIMAQLVSTVITMTISFFAHRGFSFRRTPAQHGSTRPPTSEEKT